MEKTPPISRKYRPTTFAKVKEQQSIVTTLKNSISLGRISNAYLFSGLRGTGKTTLARLFAKSLNCQNLQENIEPCNTCTSCQEIASGTSLDVLEIDGASSRGIDDIRKINETAMYAPTCGKYKIYIIDEVHMLTKEAFNALLKTLEEPPPHVKFFFATTEPNKILPTVLSRCQRLDLQRISTKSIAEKLLQITKLANTTIEQDALSYLAQIADGSMRDGESMLDQLICFADGNISLQMVTTSLGAADPDFFFTLHYAMEKEDINFAFDAAQKLFTLGKDLYFFIENCAEHFRNILLCSLGKTNILQLSKYQAISSSYSQAHLFRILDYLTSCLERFAKAPFKKIHLEMILLHLIRSKKRLDLETISKKLLELESKLSSDTISPKPTQNLVPNDNATPSSGPVEKSPTPPIRDQSSIESLTIKPKKEKPAPMAPTPIPNVAPPQKTPPPIQKSTLQEETPKSRKSTPNEKSAQMMSDITRTPIDETLMRFASIELNGSLTNL